MRSCVQYTIIFMFLKVDSQRQTTNKKINSNEMYFCIDMCDSATNIARRITRHSN